MSHSPKTKIISRELKKFFFIFISVLLIVFLFFNFGAFWQNIKYELSRLFPGKANIIGEASIIKMFENGLSQDLEINYDKDILFIGKINVEAPILVPKSTSEKDFFEVLKEGVALYPNLSKPGEQGITVITGHSSPNLAGLGKYNNVFSLLNKLDKGDVIKVYYQKQRYDYKVTAKYTFFSGEEDSKIKNTEKSTLFLISCWPVGTNFKRIGIEAELIQIP